MKLSDLTQRPCDWLQSAGPMHDVVVSTRVRLARNLAGVPFQSRCSIDQQSQLVERLRTDILDAQLADQMFYVDLAKASQLDRQVLMERHLISRPLAEAGHPRGVIISGDETIALMLNEEDHLRVQVLRSGMQLHEAFDEINRIDDILEERLDYAFSPRFGYLTACPTNVGTGLRISVMLHLPALKLTGELEKALHAARDMRLAVRGIYGEGSDALGDFFQLSNQVTLGDSEEQIVQDFITTIVPEFLRYERTAREALLENNALELDDRIFRSLAVLGSARILSSGEMMYLLSMVRLGVYLRRITHLDIKTINDCFLTCQPAHMQKLADSELEADQRAIARAEQMRKVFASNP